jgi:glucosamine--fructose-6-phosphate aminotransferase (isomerizing)
MAGKTTIERLARVPVEIDYASEFRYRDPILDNKTLVMARLRRFWTWRDS